MDIFFVYTPNPNPRISYIFDLILHRILGIKQVQITTDIDKFKLSEGAAKLNYSTQKIEGIPQILPHDLLHQTDIKPFRPVFKTYADLAATFFNESSDMRPEKDRLLPFDLFAMSFYLVTRYEEYLDFSADMHGRYTAQSSIAHQYSFLEQPLVNQWALRLKDLYQLLYPNLNFRAQTYTFVPTYDIDHAFAFLKKGGVRQSGALLRNLFKLDIETLRLQLKTLCRLQKDPYDCFEYIKQLHQSSHIQPIFFWLLGDYGPYDKNIHHRHPVFRQLIRNISEHYSTGIHPSYQSNKQQDIVAKEAQRLKKITGGIIEKSRQHYLKLTFPQTYNRLENLSISKDYSMGYANMPGFRASIATPHLWFDLKNNRISSLEIAPFQLMDVSFNSYLQFSAEETIESAKKIIDATKAVGGQLISIWHNSSLCEAWQWKGWRSTYESILEEATAIT